MDSFNIPIVLFLFKRKDTLIPILERISMIRPSKIYLLSDQGRNEEEKKLVQSVRETVENKIFWECEVIKNYASSNRGVFENIALGAKWVFEMEKTAIFLEDDNLPEISFFTYCREMLEKYEKDSRIMWVCGTNYLGKYIPKNGASYMFTKHLLPCGWASWSDKFNKYYDYNLDLLVDSDLKKRVQNEYEDKRLFRQQILCVEQEKYRKDNNLKYMSWDYHMAWSIRVNNVYGISPIFNQIKNIGVDAYSEHGGNSMKNEMTKRFCGMESYQLDFPIIHPKTLLIDLEYEKKINNIILYPFKDRFRTNLRMKVGKLFNIPITSSISKSLKTKILRKKKNV